jgi:alpha-mannosidase
MLKAAFPVDILSPVATYEIQWGNVQRPTHRNTSWDWARFETCSQKWVDLSEGDYGVSLLNDCKHGHDLRDNVMRVTLLRGPTDPDPTADLGEHTLVYSLLPHAGSWDEFTVAQAYCLNDPLLIWRTESPQPSKLTSRASDQTSFVRVAPSNVVIETIKGAEDGNGLIVRLYESQRRRGGFSLRTSFPLARAWRTNLIEENQESLEAEEHGLRCPIRPYQILTLRLLASR